MPCRRSATELLLGIDWLGFSLPAFQCDRRLVAGAIASFGAYLPREWVEGTSDSPRLCGVAARAALVDERWRIDLSGGMWPLDLLPALEALALQPGIRWHRVDLAVEPLQGGERLYRQFRRALIRGNYAGFEKGAVVEAWDGGSPAGETLYFGSRESPSFARYYRKAGRQFYRLEREFKRYRARQFLTEALTGGDIKQWAFGGLVFGDRGRDHLHRDRIVPYHWWSRLSGLSRFRSLPPAPPVAKDLARSLAWVQGSVAPTLHTLHVAGYGDRLRDVIAQAKVKTAIVSAIASSGENYQNLARDFGESSQ